MTLNIDGKPCNTDPEGYLKEIDAWTPAVAHAMAVHDDVTLTEAHWEVIHFLRGYYYEYGIAPSVRVLVRAVGERLGPDKAKSAYLYRLFPEGPARQACRYAGLPKPTGCV
ncbi:MAG: TusE/DsrC/DsvC family sulfur relay protein [Gammaproteobacteria bacterium]|nr:TusE/DsrC/DsvC family sulfur relay protein [Gammaproteobacteria bacterium]